MKKPSTAFIITVLSVLFVFIAIPLAIRSFRPNGFIFETLRKHDLASPCDIYEDGSGVIVSPPITCECKGVKISYHRPNPQTTYDGGAIVDYFFTYDFTHGTYCIGKVIVPDIF